MAQAAAISHQTQFPVADPEPRIAVLIPCYNEELTVGQVVREFRAELPEAEIYVFDNNSVDGTIEEARAAGYVFPYLVDESQAVAKLFRAACTPDLFLFDSSRRLVYRGQSDDSRPRTSTR